MTDDDALSALAFLREVLRAELRGQVRPLILDDFRARAVSYTPAQAELIEAVAAAGLTLPAKQSAVLVDSYLQSLPHAEAADQVDLLLLCPKSVELEALQLVLGRRLGETGEAPHPSGRHYFIGQLDSVVAKRPLTYTLVCLNKQTNMMTSGDVTDILQSFPARLAVLIGMAAGRRGAVEQGDVVAAEQVWYVTPGTRRDGPPTTESETYRVPAPIAEDFAAARPQHNGWHELYLAAVEKAEEAGLELPADRAASRMPSFKQAVILSVEQKNETSSLTSYMESFSGDAKALEMEAAGFASACARRGVPWLVLRGIADFGSELDPDGEPLPRDKSWQLAATLAAATAFTAWVTRQSLSFGDAESSRPSGRR